MKRILFALFVFISFSINALAGVNINTATQAELESLKDIGPVKAQAIIDYRKKNGGFKSVDELEKVDGIGPGIMKAVRNDVSVNGKTTVVAPEAKAASKSAKPTKETKKDTPVKETTKAVGTEKAAATGKVADTKEVKATTDKKDATVKAKAEVKADVKAGDTKVKADTKAKVDTKAKTSTKADTAKKE